MDHVACLARKRELDNMVLRPTGASHTGKTALAQRLMEKYAYPYLSIDHLKMGLIRSGQTALVPESPDADLTAYLWPIVREMIKTAIENGQNMIVEGCYVPFNWNKDFDAAYLEQIRYLCLVMDSEYIRLRWNDIVTHANDIERRRDDATLSPESLVSENRRYLQGCLDEGLNYFLINEEYPQQIEIGNFG